MKVLVEAPCRISLFGGSTDMPAYAYKYGGICINMAINIRQRVVLNVDDIWKLQKYDDPKFFHTIIDEFKADCGIGIEHEFNGAIGAGISSSAALAVALVGAINHYDGLFAMSKNEIAEKARDLEANKIGLLTGRQDQYCAVYGGVNLMLFGKETSVFPLGKDFMSSIFPYLQLFYLGSSRVASKILKDYEDLTSERVFAMDKIKSIAYSAIEPIKNGDINKVATLLGEAWEAKKSSSSGVSNNEVDAIYKLGLDSGALAGKVLGAGGGGHMLFLVPPSNQYKLARSMFGAGVKPVDFSIDWQGLDCRII